MKQRPNCKQRQPRRSRHHEEHWWWLVTHLIQLSVGLCELAFKIAVVVDLRTASNSARNDATLIPRMTSQNDVPRFPASLARLFSLSDTVRSWSWEAIAADSHQRLIYTLCMYWQWWWKRRAKPEWAWGITVTKHLCCYGWFVLKISTYQSMYTGSKGYPEQAGLQHRSPQRCTLQTSWIPISVFLISAY